jgi:predicted GNAT family acetyltransferase
LTLDNPVWEAISGRQSDLAEVGQLAGRFRPGIARFAAVSDPADPASWDELERLIAPGVQVAIFGPERVVPLGWTVVHEIAALQMIDTDVDVRADPVSADWLRLGPSDVPEMLDLVDRAKPGPFLTGTIELGGYIGLRRDGELIAMGGHRMRPPGWVEISAICSDPAVRGQGLGRRVVNALVGGIRADGDRAFLHVAVANTGAIKLYESMGFVFRQPMHILVMHV